MATSLTLLYLESNPNVILTPLLRRVVDALPIWCFATAVSRVMLKRHYVSDVTVRRNIKSVRSAPVAHSNTQATPEQDQSNPRATPEQHPSTRSTPPVVSPPVQAGLVLGFVTGWGLDRVIFHDRLLSYPAVIAALQARTGQVLLAAQRLLPQ